MTLRRKLVREFGLIWFLYQESIPILIKIELCHTMIKDVLRGGAARYNLLTIIRWANIQPCDADDVRNAAADAYIELSQFEDANHDLLTIIRSPGLPEEIRRKFAALVIINTLVVDAIKRVNRPMVITMKHRSGFKHGRCDKLVGYESRTKCTFWFGTIHGLFIEDGIDTCISYWHLLQRHGPEIIRGYDYYKYNLWAEDELISEEVFLESSLAEKMKQFYDHEPDTKLMAYFSDPRHYP